MKDEIKGKMNQAVGAVREKVGDLVGSDGMERKGAAQHAKGDAQESLDDARDNMNDATSNIADAVKDGADTWKKAVKS